MRVVVCGGRTYGEGKGFKDEQEANRIREVIRMTHECFGIEALAHGGAKGADSLAGGYAKYWGIPVTVFEADWDTFGPQAGPLRNKAMLDRFAPDVVIAFPGNAGTRSCIQAAKLRGILVLQVKP